MTALGKTHIEDLQNYFEVKLDRLCFEGIEIIQHNDPIGITNNDNNIPSFKITEEHRNEIIGILPKED